jgi:hypothetical protein
MHGFMARAQLDRNKAMFNSSSNIYGREICMLIGSRTLTAGHNFTNIRDMLVLTVPDNLSSFIQIIGRSIRRKFIWNYQIMKGA